MESTTDNTQKALKYYKSLKDAVDRRDYSVLINSQAPEEVDWTAIPSWLDDDFEELFGRIGEILEFEKD